MRGFSLRLLFALTIISAAGAARAENLEDAKAAFSAGKQAFERGEYENALLQFQRANMIAPAPSLSYNIGRTYEALGRYHDAALAFDRYLELAGAPKDDEDKKFQENLRARSAADRQRPDRGAVVGTPPPPQPYYPPQPVQQYPNYYQPYPPQYQNPYQPAPFNKTAELTLQRGRRNRAIALVVIGGALTITGLAMAAASDGCGANITSSERASCYGILLGIGINFAIVGPTLLIPGAVSLAKSQRVINDLSKPEPKGVQPQTFIFPAPTFYF